MVLKRAFHFTPRAQINWRLIHTLPLPHPVALAPCQISTASSLHAAVLTLWRVSRSPTDPVNTCLTRGLAIKKMKEMMCELLCYKPTPKLQNWNWIMVCDLCFYVKYFFHSVCKQTAPWDSIWSLQCLTLWWSPQLPLQLIPLRSVMCPAHCRGWPLTLTSTLSLWMAVESTSM